MHHKPKHPKDLVLLTCDAYGVMPPIASLSPAQAMYHFLSGFTSKVAGTERGVNEPEPTFSTCFGAPFLPLRPEVYGELLREKITKYNTRCWLLNTGWTGGAYGIGSRFDIPVTRRIVNAIQDGELHDVKTIKVPGLNLNIPLFIRGVDSKLLNPIENWDDKDEYQKQLKNLVSQFQENFKKYDVKPEIVSAGPGFDD